MKKILGIVGLLALSAMAQTVTVPGGKRAIGPLSSAPSSGQGVAWNATTGIWDPATYSGSYTAPTGTGFPHITSGTQDVAARAVDVSSADVTGTLAAARMPALTGDITTSAGAVATTLATVNGNVGSFGDATHVPAVTVNAKGQVTAVSSVAITAGSGDVTAASSFGTDNVALRSDGTGKGSQGSLLVIDDSGNASTPGTITAAGFYSGVNTNGWLTLWGDGGTLAGASITYTNNTTNIMRIFYTNNLVAGGLIKWVRQGSTTNYVADIAVSNSDYAALANPTFTGTPAAPTAAAGTSTTQLATTAFVQTEIDATQSGVHATPTTTNPLTPTWSGPLHTVWYGATGTINLPAASTYAGRGILIYNTGAFTITIDPNGSEVVVRDGTVQTGGVSFTLSSGAGNYVAVFCDGARWITLGFKGTLSVGS